MDHVTMRAYGELNDFLPVKWRQRDFQYPMTGGRNLKHLIESAGIPHTEVEVILVNGASAGFGTSVEPGDRIAVYPVFESLDVSPLIRLRPGPLRRVRFVLDVHLGRLAVILRHLGFDALFPGDVPDDRLADISAGEERILLTRDRMLLKRNIVARGCFIRSPDPVEQAREVLDRLELRGMVKPFTRCGLCSGLLERVAKEEVLEKLEPLTRKHYHRFKRCTACGAVYWKGSHWESLLELLRKLDLHEC